MYISEDWNTTEQHVNDYSLCIVIKETTVDKTLLTINSLFSDKEIIDEFDINVPNDINDIDFKKYPIYILTENDCFKNKYNIISDREIALKELNNKYKSFMIMNGGYYSISYEKLNNISKNIILSNPVIFNTIPYKLNFYSENSFMIPSLDYSGRLIELAILKKIDINTTIIGIDKNKFKKYFECELLSSIRTALVLNTDLKYCIHAFDKSPQLYRAKKSINMKFRDLRKSLYSRITNDKVIKSYIKLLDSFSNYCSKEDYIFYCMMQHPELYEKAVNMKFCIPSLMDVDPNITPKRTLYELLVEYTLFI